jgi:hypothetical protein
LVGKKKKKKKTIFDLRRNYIVPNVQPCMVAASLDCKAAQVQGLEENLVRKSKSGRQRGSTKGLDEEER